MALKFLERLTLFASQLTDNARLDASNIDNLPAFLGVTTVDTLGELQAITGTSTSDIRYVDSVGRFKWDGAAWQPIDRPVTPEMFGAVGDGVTDDTSAFNAAMAAQLEVVGGAKTYAVTLLEPQTGTVLSFPGSGSAKLKSIAAAGISTIDDRPNTATNWTLRGVTVDGDVATRGAGAGNNIFVDNDGATFDDVVTINSPNAGLLADGVNEITYISIQANNNTGVGLSHSSVDRINGGDIRASDNGLENLTIDGDTDIVNINNLILGQHSGGCGNVGIDCTGDINIANIHLDSGSTTVPTAGNRNGICVNAESHLTRRLNISNGVIRGCVDSGVILRDRSGAAGFEAGDVNLGAVMFEGNGEDLTIGETDFVVAIAKTCQISSISTTDVDTDQVRLAAAHIAFDRQLPSNQVVNADGAWHELTLTTQVKDRLTTQSGNGVSLPVGGIYTIGSKVRFEGLVATGAGTVSIQVKMGSQSRLINADTNGNDVVELELSNIFYAPKGIVTMEVRALGGSGTFTVASGADTTLTGANLG